MIIPYPFNITTDGSGDYTATANRPCNGYLVKVEALDTDLSAGADLTVTASGDANSIDVLTEGDFDSDVNYYPRAKACDTSAATIDEGDDTSTFAHWVRLHVSGLITVTIANGGDTKTGKVIVWIEE